ncbi:hypothetical protein DX933_17595 [Ornithinibacillus gellani]|nr:helix-turn-helix domain-containing protein [Ornithinibacillus gellani]TQS70578.1 hypothetical protein DX933_17595 [Ornithinibacillus gellani]
MLVHKAYSFRIYPTKKQTELINRITNVRIVMVTI